MFARFVVKVTRVAVISFLAIYGRVQMLPDYILFAQRGGRASPALAVVILALVVVVFAGFWKTFTKAGKPGWMSIIPIVNVLMLLEIADKPLWWFVLLCIPGVNLIAIVLVTQAIAGNFRKGPGFGLGLAFLPFIFYPILGFGDARYRRT